MLVTPELLSTFPSLKPLPEATLSQLAQQSSLLKFARRSIVLRAEEREENVCFLFEGRLQGIDFTIDGREVGLYFVEPGDFCGELGMFDRGTQPEHVIALTSAMVVMMPMEALRAVMLDNAIILQVLGERLAKRVRQMTQQRSLLALPDVSHRVCCQLWMLVPDAGRENVQVTAISNPPTHMEIAIMLNLSRESVSRVFQVLQLRQIVKRDGPGKLQIIDVSGLQRLAEGSETL